MYSDLFNPRYVFLVLELESQRADTTSNWVKVKGTPIISFAIWERKGDSEGALKWERERTEECGINCPSYLALFIFIISSPSPAERRRIEPNLLPGLTHLHNRLSFRHQ
jgi:hypothetical protein